MVGIVVISKTALGPLVGIEVMAGTLIDIVVVFAVVVSMVDTEVIGTIEVNELD